MAGVADEIELQSAPTVDWLPVFQPIIYVFKDPSPTSFFNPVITVKIEVSHNGIDFSAPLTAGILNLVSNSASEITVNPAPCLAAMFEAAPPVIGTDNTLFKLYRLSAGRATTYDGTNTPDVTTTPARCIFATEISTLNDGLGAILSLSPTEGYYTGFNGIRTKINTTSNTLTNITIDPPAIPAHPCPKYPIQLYWLNRFGGWQTWVFNGKHEYEEEVEEGVIWEDSNGHKHAASAGPVVQRVNVFSGFISKSEFDMVSTIRQALTVYHKDGNTWREILLERGGASLYKEGDKRREVNIAFTYSEPLFIQSA